MDKFIQKVFAAVDLVKRAFNYSRFDEKQVGLYVISLFELFIVCNADIIININFFF